MRNYLAKCLLLLFSHLLLMHISNIYLMIPASYPSNASHAVLDGCCPISVIPHSPSFTNNVDIDINTSSMDRPCGRCILTLPIRA